MAMVPTATTSQTETSLAPVTSKASPDTNTQAEKDHIARKVIQQMIEQLRARTDIKPISEKDRLIDALESALASGNLSVASLANVLSRVTSETVQEVAETVTDTNIDHEFARRDPEYRDYSKVSQLYIQEQYAKALANSPTLQKIEQDFRALPEAERVEAQNQQRENWHKLKDLREKAKDPNSEYHPYEEQLRVMKNLGLHNMPQGEALIKMVEEKKSIAEIQKELDKAIDARAKLAAPVIKDILPKIDADSRDFLKEKYGKADGTIDSTALIKDWSKISTKDKDEAYKAFHQHNGDVSKLTDDQKKIVHMSQVMIASDAALPMQAAIQMSQNKELAAKLTDKSVSAEERTKILETYMREQGMNTSGAFAHSNARNMIETLDENPNAFDLIKQGKIQELGSYYQANIAEDMGVKGTASYDKLNPYTKSFGIAAYASAKADAEIPAWIAKDPERLKAYQADRAEWQRMEEKLLKAYDPNEYAKPPAEPEKPMSREELRAINPMVAYYDQLPSLAAVGVTGGQNVSPADDRAAVVNSALTPDKTPQLGG